MIGKTIVIGLDGANWDFLKHWIEKEELPNLKYLRDNGSWANSVSQLPTVTCPNWKCYSTGKNPGKFGVFWWEQVDREKKKLVNRCKSYLFDSFEIFDYIGNSGLKVGVINMPTTYPPKKVNGFMISGHPVVEEKDYTYPKSLEKKLKEKYNYRVNPKNQTDTAENVRKTAEEINSLIDLRFKVGMDFIKDVDFLQITVFYINILQHFLFDEDSTLKGWKIIDKNIGDFIDNEYNIILLSDHGIHRVYRTFYKNTWLEREGYLRLKKSYSDRAIKLQRDLGLTRERLSWLTHKLKIKVFLKRYLPKETYESIPSQDGSLFSESGIPEHKIDWENSKALATGQGSIYLLLKRDDEEYKKVREEIIKKLEGLRTDNNLKVAEKVYRSEEVYHGKYLDQAPDIIYEQGRGVYSVGGVGRKNYFAEPTKWKAENLRQGIFLAYGPSIRNLGRINDISILDIAPTILHLMNVPIPRDMDGRVIEEIFREKKTVEYIDVDEKQKLRGRIQNLKKQGKL